MYVLRGLAVSLETFFLLYVCLSAVVALCSRTLVSYTRRFSPAKSAGWLFGVRISPLLVSLAITACFTIPSFVRFEPHSTDEPIGLPAIVLSCAGLALIATGLLRAARASRRTSRQVAAWVNSASPVQIYAGVPVFGTAENAPALAVSGVRSPTLLISRQASAEFTEEEMRAAVAHELAHVRCRDNFKKVLLCICGFPGMSALERAWAEAAEIAADDAAVANEREALDLASALIKTSRLGPSVRTPDLAMSLVPDSSLINERVQRLLAWRKPRQSRSRDRYAAFVAVCLTVGVGMLSYAPALGCMHAITELLIR